MRVGCDSNEGPVWRIGLSAGSDGDIALSAEGLSALGELLERAEQSPRCRVLVLQGKPGTFCRGMDLAELSRDPGPTIATGTRQYAACLRALRGSSKAVIALVDGAAVAGGVGLAVAADVVIATRAASFGLPELALGLVPAMVLALLLERMPPQRARRWALSAQSIDAEEAARWGLVDRLVDDTQELERGLRAELKSLLRVKPEAVARLKALTSRAAPLGWEQALDEGASCTDEVLADPASIDAVRAFIEGEPLPWFERLRPRRGSP